MDNYYDSLLYNFLCHFTLPLTKTSFLALVFFLFFSNIVLKLSLYSARLPPTPLMIPSLPDVLIFVQHLEIDFILFHQCFSIKLVVPVRLVTIERRLLIL